MTSIYASVANTYFIICSVGFFVVLSLGLVALSWSTEHVCTNERNVPARMMDSQRENPDLKTEARFSRAWILGRFTVFNASQAKSKQ